MVRRALAVLAWMVSLALVGHAWFRHASLQEFAKAHEHAWVLVGDSHADDVKWGGRPRFSGPAQDLFSSLKMVESLKSTAMDSSKIRGVVLTFWPNKFSPLAERRLSGLAQEDNWGSMAFGRIAPLMTLRDLVRPEVPLRYRVRMAFHTLQFKTTFASWDEQCEQDHVGESYRYGLSEDMRLQNWWDEARVSPGLFQAIVDKVTSQGWHLVLLENPLHPTYYDQVNPEALVAYERWMASFEAHPSGRVHRVSLGRENDDFTLFRDYHHLTCKGEAYLREELDKVLERISPGAEGTLKRE